MAGPPIFPNINGFESSFCSIRFQIGPGLLITGIKTVNYKDVGEIPKVRGASAIDIGRTRGKVSSEGDIEILAREWDNLLPFLTQGSTVGYMETIVPAVQVSYDEPGSPENTTTDSLVAVRFHSPEKSYSESTDANYVKLQMSIMAIVWNGAFVGLRSGLAFGGL